MSAYAQQKSRIERVLNPAFTILDEPHLLLQRNHFQNQSIGTLLIAVKE